MGIFSLPIFLLFSCAGKLFVWAQGQQRPGAVLLLEVRLP